MPRTRALETYPNAQFLALTERVLGMREPFTVPCTRPQALTIMGELYAWRRACEANPGHAESLGIPVSALRSWCLRLAEDGLTMLPEDQRMTTAIINAALGSVPAPLQSEAAQALARLQAQIAEDANGSE